MNAYYNIPWMHLRIGQQVHRADDERHLGRIVAILSSIYVKVQWDDTGWRSIEHANELVRMPTNVVRMPPPRYRVEDTNPGD